MSADLHTRAESQPLVPPTPPPVQPPPVAPRVPGRGREVLLLPLLLLLTAAILPLARVYIGWGFLRPVLSAVLIAVGLSWGCRRCSAGPLVALAVSVLGWVAFVGAAFLGSTTVLGAVPTPSSLEAFRDLWAHGFAAISARPAPTVAEPSLLLLTVTGVWALTHAVDGIVFRLEAPAKGILPALGLWLVPLLLTIGHGSPAAWAVPFLAASALLVGVATNADPDRWARSRSGGRRRSFAAFGVRVAPGVLIAGGAIALGVLLAATLPGFADPPWYEFGGVGGTTLTTNPIVSIKPSLVAADQGPIMRVTTDRPVYLRTTSLDVYSDTGEWTNAGIRGNPVSGSTGLVRPEYPVAQARPLDVEVEVINLPGAVLVPAPYQPRAVTGEAASGFQFDQRLATLTTAGGVTLQPGDRYRVSAAVPDPQPESVRARDGRPRPADTQLPPNVPAAVVDLARTIVENAGARSPFEQALAIQEEFQSGRWTYSVDPPQGHSGDAMLAFITHRIGYCEQFAGTMAVMLRSLGIPARVAVGFTPGEQGVDDVYVVTNGNAHAWVEVLFPGQGWLAFEPTPRDDGNLLPPSPQDLAPELTVRQQAAVEPVEVPDTLDPVLPEEDSPAAAERADEAAAPATDAEHGDGGVARWLLALVALVALGSVAALVRRRYRTAAPPTPLARVLAARARVARVGRGLGIAGTSSETDREYLGRLAAASSAPQAPATAAALAERVARARYAPDLPVAVAQDAEAAASALRASLLAGRSATNRAAVLLRGTASAAAGRVTTVLNATADRLRRR